MEVDRTRVDALEGGAAFDGLEQRVSVGTIENREAIASCCANTDSLSRIVGGPVDPATVSPLKHTQHLQGFHLRKKPKAEQKLIRLGQGVLERGAGEVVLEDIDVAGIDQCLLDGT